MTKTMPEVSPVFAATMAVEPRSAADSFRVTLSKSHGVEHTVRIRVLGVDAPERRGATLAAGNRARDARFAWYEEAVRWSVSEEIDEPLVVHATESYDRYGRVLSTVWRRSDGSSLAEWLIENGHGVAVSAMAQIAKAEGE